MHRSVFVQVVRNQNYLQMRSLGGQLRILFFFVTLLLTQSVAGQRLTPVPSWPAPDASFRGLSVVNDHVIWASGSKGTVVRSVDGGKTWDKRNPAGHDKLDFRSLYAFDEHHAVVANAGSPAFVLRTDDGGKTWNMAFTSTHADAFLDGIDFWNATDGLLYGDPMDGKMLMLRTRDGGKSWSTVSTAPTLEKGEASFAASGTGIRCTGEKDVMICTGGTVSRLWISNDAGQTWRFIQPPVVMGKPSTGIFSLALRASQVTLVGGDFQEPALRTGHHLYSNNGGATWEIPAKPVTGYRECVEVLDESTLITVGPNAIDVTSDGGNTWESLSSEMLNLHVVRKARKGSRIAAAGGKGIICLFENR